MLLADRASASALANGEESVRLRAEVLAVFACNQLGRGASAGGRAVRALRAAQAVGAHVTERLVRVELAACAVDASAPAIALAQLQPVLVGRWRLAPTARAAAMVTAADALAKLGGGPEVPSLLTAADALYDASRAVEPDAVLLRRGVVHGRLAAHHRRVGDHDGAERSARAGLALLDELSETEHETGQVSGSLTLELVLALLGSGREAEAVLAAQTMLRRSIRPAGAPAACWLRLALASRVHLPAGRYSLARRLLGDAAFVAERNQLDSLLAECQQLQAQLHEQCAELPDALGCLRAAQRAERRWRSCAGELRTLLAAEFGMPPSATELRSVLSAAIGSTAPGQHGAEHESEAEQVLPAWSRRAVGDIRHGSRSLAGTDRTSPMRRRGRHAGMVDSSVADLPLQSVGKTAAAEAVEADVSLADSAVTPEPVDVEDKTVAEPVDPDVSLELVGVAEAAEPLDSDVPLQSVETDVTPESVDADVSVEPSGAAATLEPAAADAPPELAGAKLTPEPADAGVPPGPVGADVSPESTDNRLVVPEWLLEQFAETAGSDERQRWAAIEGQVPKSRLLQLEPVEETESAGTEESSAPWYEVPNGDRAEPEGIVSEQSPQHQGSTPYQPLSPDEPESYQGLVPQQNNVSRLERRSHLSHRKPDQEELVSHRKPQQEGSGTDAAEVVMGRVLGRHRSDVALADLLAEALVAYQDGRRSQLAASSTEAAAVAEASIEPVTREPTEPEPAWQPEAALRHEPVPRHEPELQSRPQPHNEPASQPRHESALRPEPEPRSRPESVTRHDENQPEHHASLTQPTGMPDLSTGPIPLSEIMNECGDPFGSPAIAQPSPDEFPPDLVWREPGTF